jgi:hypothetical protein
MKDIVNIPEKMIEWLQRHTRVLGKVTFFRVITFLNALQTIKNQQTTYIAIRLGKNIINLLEINPVKHHWKETLLVFCFYTVS